MQIEIRREYHPFEDYFFLRLDLNFNDEQQSNEVRDMIYHQFRDLSDALRREFETQGALYELIDARFTQDPDKYKPNEALFLEADIGFREFIKDLTERDVQKLTDLYADLISARITHMEDMQRQQMTARVALTPRLSVAEDNVSLDKIGINAQNIIVANDKAYAFELKELDGVTSIDQMKDEIYNTIYNDLNSQMLAQKASYQRKMAQLRAQTDRDKNELFTETLRNASEILKNWKFIEFENDLYLQYNSKIVVDRIVKDGYTYPYPGEPEYKEIYVTGLKVRIVPRITEQDVKITRGYNPHFRGTTGCIGSMNGRPLFEVLRVIPDSLRIANMDSPLNNDIASRINREFLNAQREEQSGNRETEWFI